MNIKNRCWESCQQIWIPSPQQHPQWSLLHWLFSPLQKKLTFLFIIFPFYLMETHHVSLRFYMIQSSPFLYFISSLLSLRDRPKVHYHQSQPLLSSLEPTACHQLCAMRLGSEVDHFWSSVYCSQFLMLPMVCLASVWSACSHPQSLRPPEVQLV